MTRKATDAVTTVREVADEPRTIEGVAVPYGAVAIDTELGREAFAPEAFRDSVAAWMGRKDGGRMPFRPAHKEKPVGTVTSLDDTPAGVTFRAAIFDGPRGDDYLSEVRAGLNGVSIEAGLNGTSRKMRDGTTLHRAARLYGIAGSTQPAYDGARIALRDMEETMSDETAEKPQERDAATAAVTPIPNAERERVELADPAVLAITRSGDFQITRAEAVYGPRSGHGFFRDMELARTGNSEAIERQSRHDRHLTDISNTIERVGDVVSSEIPGAYPNEYLPGLLTPRILKGRPMGGFYNRTPISDGTPKIFAKVTTSTTVAVQSAEGTNPAASDFATTSVTVTPLIYGAETVVSRQVIDGSSPAGESMIIQDMLEAYAQASETVIKTAVEAGATASGSAITAATPYAGLIANIVAYQQARFTPAEAQFIPPALYTTELAQADTAGRALLAYSGPQNASGSQGVGANTASLLGVDQKLSWASTLNVVVTGRPSDYVIFESSIARFSYEAVTGPAGVRLGIWAYLVVGTRLGSLKVTAA